MDSVLVYVRPGIKNIGEEYEYELFFSNTPDIVWGVDWDINNPVSCGDISPEKSTYSEIKKVTTALPFKTIEETSCYSMEYAINGSVALAWIDIENLEEYPENGRCVLHFGDSEEKVKQLLEKQGYNLK